jgi:hypothetical protein
LPAKIAAHLNIPPETRAHAARTRVHEDGLDSMTDNFFALSKDWRYSYATSEGKNY